MLWAKKWPKKHGRTYDKSFFSIVRSKSDGRKLLLDLNKLGVITMLIYEINTTVFTTYRDGETRRSEERRVSPSLEGW